MNSAPNNNQGNNRPAPPPAGNNPPAPASYDLSQNTNNTPVPPPAYLGIAGQTQNPDPSTKPASPAPVTSPVSPPPAPETQPANPPPSSSPQPDPAPPPTRPFYAQPSQANEPPVPQADINISNEPIPEPTVYPAGGGNQLPPSHGFPFMMVTAILVTIIIGFGGSFAYFRFFSKNTGNDLISELPSDFIPSITLAPSPTIKPTETVAQIFATPTITFQNPFATPSATYENPFTSSYENPFSEATLGASMTSETYQNPFADLQ